MSKKRAPAKLSLRLVVSYVVCLFPGLPLPCYILLIHGVEFYQCSTRSLYGTELLRSFTFYGITLHLWSIFCVSIVCLRYDLLTDVS